MSNILEDMCEVYKYCCKYMCLSINKFTVVCVFKKKKDLPYYFLKVYIHLLCKTHIIKVYMRSF